MMWLVALTGGAGFLASFTLLHAGLDAMALRYPLALAVAYLFFLCLLWLWLRTRGDGLDVPDVSGLIPSGPKPGHSASHSDAFASGKGGDFGGGGASASFDAPEAPVGAMPDSPMKAMGDAASSVGDADELAIPLLAIIMAMSLALASLYVVYIAPVLFAEVLVDGALSYALFRHLRSEDRPLWLSSAVRHTFLPFAITAVFLMAIGAAMSAYAPEAKSIGQVIEHSKSSEPPP
jgi:hypothetical protein